MSAPLYISTLRTLVPSVGRIEFKDGAMTFQYEKKGKPAKHAIKLDKEPKVNLEAIHEFANKL